jgi:hypothetical protein
MKLNVVTFLIVTLALVVGGYFFFTGTESQPLLEVSASDNPAQARFQALVSQLQPISFDTSIFSDPTFTSLVDLATPVAPEESGRLDPFAPLSGAVSSAAGN